MGEWRGCAVIPVTVRHDRGHDSDRTSHFRERTTEETQGPHPLAVYRGCRRGGARCGRRHAVAGIRQVGGCARRDIRQSHQDDDQPGDLLHHRAGHRIGTQGRKCGTSGRIGVRVLPGDVDGRTGDRTRCRQSIGARHRFAPFGLQPGCGSQVRGPGSRHAAAPGTSSNRLCRRPCSRR